MKQTHRRDNLLVEFDPRHCQLTPAEIDHMLVNLDALSRQVAHFPTADLRILIEHNERNSDYSVKTTLILDGSTLVSTDHDGVAHAAFERCLNNLSANVKAYKDRLGQVPERQRQEKGTVQEVEPTLDPDPIVLEEAVRADDYTSFRMATFGYEEALRDRVGRWVQRYPEIDARIGTDFTIHDLVEEVFLTAFENYGRRPREVRFGDWLGGLIDSAVKKLQRHPDEELENVRLAQSAREAEQGPGTG